MSKVVCCRMHDGAHQLNAVLAVFCSSGIMRRRRLPSVLDDVGQTTRLVLEHNWA